MRVFPILKRNLHKTGKSGSPNLGGSWSNTVWEPLRIRVYGGARARPEAASQLWPGLFQLCLFAAFGKEHTQNVSVQWVHSSNTNMVTIFFLETGPVWETGHQSWAQLELDPVFNLPVHWTGIYLPAVGGRWAKGAREARNRCYPLWQILPEPIWLPHGNLIFECLFP